MPPPVEFSDDGSSSGESYGESIPYGDGAGNGKNENNAMDIDRKSPAAEKKPADDESDEDDEEEEEDVYIVERVMGHEFAKNGKLLLQVKWKGYDNPEDETMEPEENLLDGAKEILEDYYKKQGGRPVKPTKAAKAASKKRKSLPETNVKKETPKKRSKFMAGAEESQEVSLSWVPKGKSWETDVSSVETILRDKDGNLYAYLNWRNGKKSKILIETCYEKCPQKMLQFYEQHLVFKDEAST